MLRSQLKAEVTNRNALLRTCCEKVTRVCLGVEVKDAADPLQMSAARLKLEASKTVRVGKPGAPEEFRAAPTESEGEARLRWRRPVRRCTFEIEHRADNAADWTHAEMCLQQTCLVRGLTSGVKYWFRVRATNAHGPGPWGGVVAVRVK